LVATGVPQLAQNESSSGRMVEPQVGHAAAGVSVASVRRPQWGQNGSPLSMTLEHQLHVIDAPGFTRVGGMIEMAGSGPVRRTTLGLGRRCEGALKTRSALGRGGGFDGAARGFPQSTQKRASWAFV
jgi:hypothetical protein